MIKKIYLSLIFITAVLLFSALPARANDWGVFERYTQNHEDFALSYALDGEPVLYYLIIDEDTKKKKDSKNKETSIKTELENELSTELMNEEKANSLAVNVDKSFKLWFEETASAIKNAGRSEEFADIMDILNDSIQTKRVYDREEADIVVHYTTDKKMEEECGNNAAACISLYEVPRVITLVTPDHYKTFKNNSMNAVYSDETLFHEIGHFYGLVDQYKDYQDSSLIYSTEDRFEDYNSVMGASYTKTLGCDDVDGFINLIDITLSLENDGEFSQRAKEGWASFCNGKQQRYTNGKNYKDTFYKEGKITNKDTYERGSIVYKYDEDGNVAYKRIRSCSYKYDKDGKEVYSYCHLDDNKILVNYKNRKFLYEENSTGEKIFIPSGVGASRSKTITLNTNKECKAINYSPVSTKRDEGFNLILKDGRLQEYSGNIFLIKKYIPAEVIKDKDNTCHLKLGPFDLFTINGNNISDEHKSEIDFCMKQYSLTKDELITIAKDKCYNDIPQEVIDGTADICNFMENLEIFPEE